MACSNVDPHGAFELRSELVAQRSTFCPSGLAAMLFGGNPRGERLHGLGGEWKTIIIIGQVKHGQGSEERSEESYYRLWQCKPISSSCYLRHYSYHLLLFNVLTLQYTVSAELRRPLCSVRRRYRNNYAAPVSIRLVYLRTKAFSRISPATHRHPNHSLCQNTQIFSVCMWQYHDLSDQ
ncbi:hypothetical protein BDY19DRAFT_277279 [Irpex rosettiformis]|uniref:Uncharacterized protein n=1 Tax=Irpex rosettiformis TaxID=378272 RepID=A0ACB8UHR0_9APHY|nr:hypothetical protein BDY19DRAFT_277279 [Irpex rosettiformis]